MRFIFTLVLFFSFTASFAQFSTELSTGINSKATPSLSMEISYKFPKINVGTGYIIAATDKVEEPTIFFVRSGKTIFITPKSGIDLGGGLAVLTTKQLSVSKVDNQYSYYNKSNKVKLLLYTDYRRKILRDGEIFTRAVYTGNTFFLGAGISYIFSKKKC